MILCYLLLRCHWPLVGDINARMDSAVLTTKDFYLHLSIEPNKSKDYRFIISISIYRDNWLAEIRLEKAMNQPRVDVINSVCVWGGGGTP